MDPATLSTVAVALIATKFGEGAATEAGSAAWQKIQSVAQAVRQRFGRSQAQSVALAELEASPGDVGARATVADQLRHEVESDSEFAAALEALVTAAQRDPVTQTLIAHASGNARQVNISGSNSGPISLS
ncbi:hypothetical protein [Streptomyces sp. NBC_00687]|uniref:hypothetical protein n=1 Tax=Streptomyces sp. NBC_00687 TaxID=2975807 RepID=UPI00225428F9|nr:hypothetical protein [Streptomyces sp. NBC_00687]MCX4920083.1 hypothetical protein [Streptomyces sp. NBC_00687]